jgi:hypothetical protein
VVDYYNKMGTNESFQAKIRNNQIARGAEELKI